MSSRRKHDDHALVRKQLLDSFEWANEVAISRDKQRDVKAIPESVSYRYPDNVFDTTQPGDSHFE